MFENVNCLDFQWMYEKNYEIILKQMNTYGLLYLCLMGLKLHNVE